MSQLYEIYFAFAFNHIDSCMCKKTTFLGCHLIVKIDLIEVVYYLKHLLYDKSYTPAEALATFFNMIDSCII